MDILRYYSKDSLEEASDNWNIKTDIDDVDGIFKGYLSLESRLLEAMAGDGKTGGVYKLRGTVIWKLVTPLRKIVHHFRLSRQVFQAGGMRALGRRYADFFNPRIIGIKIYNKYLNSSSVRRKKGHKFLTEVLPSEEEKKLQRENVFENPVKISILVPLYNTPTRFLKDMIDSVVDQTYPNWELCLADASDDAHTEVHDVVMEYCSKDERIVYKKLEKNGGISENTNECIEMSSGDYISLFDHDDILHPCALFYVMQKIDEENADFVYTDEATFEGESLETLIAYHFKPDFSYDNLRGVNYICHLTTFKKSLLSEIGGGFRPEYDGSQDHDIILRLTSKAKRVSHVPRILYFWRSHSGSTAQNIGTKSYAVDAGLKAVADAEAARGYDAKSYCTQICLTHYRVIYEIKGNPMVSIIVFGGDENDQAYTLSAISERITYDNYEVIVSSSMSEKMNEAVAAANGEYVLFLAAGSNPVNADFVQELLMLAQREDAGMVAGRVLNDRKRIIHCDKAFGANLPELFIETNPDAQVMDTGFMGRMYYAHNTSAVNVQFTMINKALFEKLGGFDTEYKSDGYDYDFSFIVRNAGKNIIVNPYAMTMRRNSETNSPSAASLDLLRKRFADEIKNGDPFYNKNLSFTKLWEKKEC